MEDLEHAFQQFGIGRQEGHYEFRVRLNECAQQELRCGIRKLTVSSKYLIRSLPPEDGSRLPVATQGCWAFYTLLCRRCQSENPIWTPLLRVRCKPQYSEEIPFVSYGQGVQRSMQWAFEAHTRQVQTQVACLSLTRSVVSQVEALFEERELWQLILKLPVTQI